MISINSKNKRLIRLTDERIKHICDNHPEMKNSFAWVLETIETPDFVLAGDFGEWDYDAEADVLYISFGKPEDAEGIDIGEGTIIRIRPDSQEIIGVTILNPVNRTLASLRERHPLT